MQSRQACHLWNSSLKVKLRTWTSFWCFKPHVLDFFKNSPVFMRLISSRNKALVCPLANPPIWPVSLWLETLYWALVHFSWLSFPLPLLSQCSGRQSEIRRALFPQASHFFQRFWHCFGAVALNGWPQSPVKNTFYMIPEPTSGVCLQTPTKVPQNNPCSY